MSVTGVSTRGGDAMKRKSVKLTSARVECEILELLYENLGLGAIAE